MKGSKKYLNKNWLYQEYQQKEFCVSEIAKECGTEVTTISRWLSRFEIREIRPYKGNRKGPKNSYWNGGKYKDRTSGYIWVYNPDHPLSNKKGYVLEHRLVMEKSIGRYLKKKEVVRHKNKAKDDNRVKNLELITLGESNYEKVL